MIMPGMQKPHWTAKWSTKACWIGCKSPCDPSASIVSISLPAIDAIDSPHAIRASPSIMTVEAPQTPPAQPHLTPLYPAARRVDATSASIRFRSPFTVRVYFTLIHSIVATSVNCVVDTHICMGE